MPDETPGPGHNLAPTQAEQLSAILEDATKELMAKVAEFTEAVQRIPEEIPDEEWAEKVTLIVGQIGRWEKETDTQRKARKKVYDDLGKVVQAHFKPVADGLAAAKAAAQGKLTVYLLAKREAARVEQERLRQEAEEKAAEAAETGSVEAQQEAANAEAKADRVVEEAGRTITDYGQTASVRKTWKVEITDFKTFVAAVAKGEYSLEWLEINESAIKKAAQAGLVDEVAGLRVWQDEKANVRN